MVICPNPRYDRCKHITPKNGDTVLKQAIYKTFIGFVSMFLGLAILVGPTAAAELRQFYVAGNDGDLREELLAASLVADSGQDAPATPRAIVAAAQADYGRLLRVLYANGFYSGVVRIRLDGREAAEMPGFSLPARINSVTVRIDPGPPFRFGAAEIVPLPPQSRPPEGFRRGAVARSTVLQETVDSAVGDWRDAGHAKVKLRDQQLKADHASRTLAARFRLSPGPVVRFGKLRQMTPSAVRAARIQRIAGLPTGQVFSPDEKAAAANRLRRTGAFSSVALSEAETLGPENRMDIELELADEKPRRFGFGAEVSSFEGLALTGFWLHRNLLGGAERFRIEGEVAGIGGQSGGVDYGLEARLDIPAAFRSDIDAFLFAQTEFEDEPTYRSWNSSIGGGVIRTFSDTLTVELGLALRYSETRDAFGKRQFFLATFPGEVIWDKRNNALNPTSGYYLKARATPFADFDRGGGGLRFLADGRAYRSLDEDENFVLAGRLQFGAVMGAPLADLPPDFLFYSGGGGTVRGHPYQSLGVDLGGGNRTGGKAFFGASSELRAKINETIGIVGFVDAGFIGADGFTDGTGDWHAGAGVGLRYNTGIGPLRLDVAVPISGSTGDGVQVYIGIGQAF